MTEHREEQQVGFNEPDRVIVVGPCASGKSTLVHGLREIGYDAFICAQEHSDIPTLWRRSSPSAILALDVNIYTLRRRRDDHWPESLLVRQHERLADAFAEATALIDTSHLSSMEVLAKAAKALRGAGITPVRSGMGARETGGDIVSFETQTDRAGMPVAAAGWCSKPRR